MNDCFFTIPRHILRNSNLQTVDKFIISFLRDYRSENGWGYYTHEEMAVLLGLSRSTIRRSLRRLQDSGYVTSIPANGGRKQSSAYFVHKTLFEIMTGRDKP